VYVSEFSKQMPDLILNMLLNEHVAAVGLVGR